MNTQLGTKIADFMWYYELPWFIFFKWFVDMNFVPEKFRVSVEAAEIDFFIELKIPMFGPKNRLFQRWTYFSEL